MRRSLAHANRAGDTPFELACDLGKCKLVELMLKSVGADELGGCVACTRALHKAVRNGHDEVVRILLSYGVCELDALLEGGGRGEENEKVAGIVGSALHEACRYGRYQTAKILLESGANTEVRNSLGQLPVDVIIKQKVIIDIFSE